MTWSAMDRYGMDPAPGSLALAQDLLSSKAMGNPRRPDLLRDVDDARRWAAAASAAWADATATARQEWDLRAADLPSLRELRSALVSVIEARDGLAPGGEAPQVPATVGLAIGADGRVVAEASGDGRQRIVANVLLAIRDAEMLDTWRRLKVCRNDRCRGVFYDRSKNNSRVWHDVKTCGNVENLRAMRARRRAEEEAGG